MATVFERWAQTAGELKAAKATPEQAEAAREELRKRFVEKMKEAKLDSAARAVALSRFESGTNALSIKHGLKKEADPLTEDERYAAENPVLGGITQAGKELVAPLAQGVQRIAGGAARLLNDIGDNEKGTALDRFANSMDDAQASVDDWAGQGYAEADGVRGFAKSALQNAPQIALSLLPGAALGKAASLAKAAKGAQAGAKVLKYGMPVAAGLSFGQNYAGEYGDARKQTEDKLAKASPDDLRASEVYGSDFESLERKFFEEGMSADDAAVAARDALVDSISENRADSAATINTALEFVAPGAMAVMPGFAKTGSRLASDLALAGKMASGGRFGSKAANLSDLKDVGLQFLQEGAQGGVTERVAEGARANAFNDEVNYGGVLKSAALEGLAGGIIGGGTQMASGGTSRRRAQDAVKEAQSRREQYSAALNNAKAERQRLSEIRNQRPLTEDEKIELSAATMEERQASAAISEIDKMMSEAGLRAPATPPAPQPSPASGLSGVVQRAQTSTLPDLTTVVNEAIASGQTPDFGALAQASNRDRSEVVDLFNRRRTLVDLAESGDLGGMRDIAARMTADPQEQQALIEQAVAVRDKRRAMAAQPQQATQQPAAPASPIKTPRDTAYEKMLADAEGAIASGASEVDAFLAIRKKYAGNKDLTETDINGVMDDAKASVSSKQQAAANRAAAIESAIPHLKAGDEVSAVTALADAGISGDADIRAALKEASGRIKAENRKAPAATKQEATPTAPAKSPMDQAVAAADAAQAAGKAVNLVAIAKKFGVGIADLAVQVAKAKRAPANTKHPDDEKPRQPSVLALPAPQDAPIPSDQPLVSRRGKLMPKPQADAMSEQSDAEKRDMRRAMAEEAGNPTGVPSGMRPRVEATARAPQKAVLPDVILRTDGKPFPNEAEATRAMNRKGAQETHEVAPATQGEGVVVKRKRANVIDMEKDDILAAIAKAGGVNWEQARKHGGFDPAESGRRGSGILRVFKKNGGMTLDGMAEHLSQFGYPVTDADGNYTVNALLDAMDAAMSGSQIGTPQFNERLAREMHEQEAEWRALDDAFDGKTTGNAPPAWLDDGADAMVESLIDGGTQPSAVLADALNEVENERTIASPAAGTGQKADAGAEARGGQGGNAPAVGGREAGQQEGQGGAGQDSGDQGFQLTAQTEAERLAEEQRQAADLEAKRKEEEKALLKAQADRELSSFTLTGSDRPADVAMAAGQNDLFAPKTRGEKAAEKSQPKTDATISDADYAQVVEAAKYLKDIVYSMDNLVGDDADLLIALSSDLGKSGRDTILMDAFGIDRNLAHAINNRLDERKPHKLRAVDMDDAFTTFPTLRKVVDDAREVVRKRDERRAARDAEGKAASQKEKNATPSPSANESKPEPVKWFGSRDKAEAWIAKVSRVNGGAYHVVQAGPSRFEVFAGKKAAAPAAPVEPNSFPIGKDGMPLRKAIVPLSQADALIALMEGNKIVFNRDTEYQEEIWLEENKDRNTWVVKTRSGGAIVTEGPAGPRGAGWSQMDAAARAVDGKAFPSDYGAPGTPIPTDEAISIATEAGRKRASEIVGWRTKQSGRASVREAITKALWEAAPAQKATEASDDVDRIYKTLFDEKEAPANPIPGGPGYTSEMADKDLDAMLEQQYRNGIVADDRLAERIRRQEKLIETLRAEERAKQSPAEDLDSMFDDVLAEVTGKPKAEPAKQERTASQAAASAAKNTGMALGEAIDGLGKLFGGKGTLGSGLVFDEETYAKAKPYFIAAISHLKAAGSDLREAMRAVVKMVVDKFGADTAENMKPYVVQFISDVRDGKIGDPAATLNGSNTNEDAGNDVRKLDTASQGALEGVSPGQVQGAAAGRGTGAGTDEGGRGNGGADGSVAGAGGDRNGGVGDRAERVSVSGTGAGGAGRGRGRTASGKGRAVSGGPAAGNEPVVSAGLTSDASQPGMALEPGRIDPPQLPDDFIIEEDLALGEGGQRTKYKNNVEAIRLIRNLEATGRTATTDDQKVLAKYVGWGGIPQAFDPDNKDWSAQYAELKSLLSADEWDAAFESTQYAHYTSREIINGMYAAVRRLGFTGGNVLEAGGGVGNFIGLMPIDLRTNGKVTLVERENIAAAIAKHLYPRQNVRAEDFTEFGKGQDGQYDMQIGNPPFHSTPLTDKSGRKHLTGLSVHNYFIAKGVDMLRDGGIMAVVVSNSFMDAGNVRAREYIAKRAKLLGAIRLPNNAFSKNANTQVTTDIIFLQKLPESEWGSKAAVSDGKRWVGVTTVNDPQGKGEVALNQYFADNRSMMLGAWGKFGTMYGPDQPALVARSGQDTGAMLMRAIAALPEGVYTPASVSRTKAMEGALLEKLHDKTVDEGGFYVNDGKLWRRVADAAGEEYAAEITPNTVISGTRPIGQSGVERLRQLAGIRRTMRDLLAAEAEDRKSDMDRLRKELNTRYDAYIADNGRINDPTTKRLMRDDPDYPLIAALEMGYEPGIGPAAAKSAGIKPQKSKATKAAIFNQRVIDARKAVTKADTPQDAINISMAERGRLDAEYIGRLLDVPADEVLGQLASGAKPLLFRDPATNEYVLRDAYLSGNVREKLKQAKSAGLMSNARALEEVQPEDIPASQISVRLGSPWVPVSVYADFASHLFGEGTKALIRYVKSNGAFSGVVAPGSSALSETKYGTKDYNGDALLLALMNNRQIKVTYRDSEGKTHVDKEATEQANSKADDIKQAFQDWAFKDSDRAETMVRAYNDANNNYVVRKYDGSWLKFPGKVPDAVIRFRRHQRDAIARTIQDRTTLYDHVVGAGKTFTAIASAMEMRRMGLVRKPLMVVPNHLVGQWASDFYRLYPGAKVLAATKKDFERENRRRFLAKIASGDWDAVIIAHSSFERIRPSPEFEQRFIQAEIDRIMREAKEVEKSDGDEQEKKRTVKQLAAMQERLENRIARLRDKPMDDLLDFQQLGVDQLFVDEAHLFKNLMFTTKMQNVRGLGDPTGSQRAYDMYIKTNQIMEQNGRGQGVTFMTGTPVSNSLAEMYHMMRYLMPRQMQQLGFESFDAWANTYASVNQVWMQTAGGDGFKAQNRMSNFDNVPELLRLFDQVADTVTMDDIKAAYKEETGKDFPLPKLLTGRRQPVSLDKTPAQEAYMKEIVERLKKIEGRKGPPKKGEDNHLTVMSDARKAAMDIRLVDSAVIDREKGARVDRASEEIFARWKKHGADLGTQLVFADLGTPVSTVKSEVKEYEAIMARISAGEDPDTIAMAQLGDDSAAAKVSDAEDARSELDAKGQDWLTAIEAASRGFSIYDDLKKALVEKGIPEDQIAFIHSYNTDDQKATLFRKVNKGEIRILMGSTAKMGAGTNVQKRLVALHHLDVPWKPSDLEQREGRIIRQGNELADKNPDFEVEILAYVTKDTLDMRMWQIQEVKLKMINQLRTRKIERELENAFEDMEMSAGEMQAAATGNMDMLREIQLRTEVQKLEKKQRAFDAGNADAIAGIRRATREIERLPAQIAAYERLNKASEAVLLDVFTARNKFKATINGKEYSNHTEAAKVLRDLVDAVEVGEDGKERKAKLDVNLNGEQFTNRQKLAEAFARLTGDNEPFVFDAGDGKVYRIDDAADAVMDTVASARDTEGEKLLGDMGDYKVSIEYGGEKLNQDEVFEVHASLGDDDLPSAVVRAKPGDDRHTAKEILKTVRNMVRDAGSALGSLKASLEKAKKNLADLSKIDTTSEWPDSDKLARMRDEHRRLRNKINRNDGSLSYDVSFFLAEDDSGMIRVVGESGNAFSGQPAAGFSSETDAGEWIRNQLMEKISKDYKEQGIQMRLIRRDSRAYGAPEYIVTHGSQVYEPDGEYYADRESASSFFASWNDALESGVFTGKKKPASPVSRLKGERMDPIPDALFSAADTSGPGLTTSRAREILSADPVLSKALPFIDIRNSKEGVPDGAEPFGEEGYYHSGRITLFSDNIRATGSMSAEERLKWVAFHEITHRGVANLAESQSYLSELERAGKNPYVKNLAKKIYEARQSLDEKYHVSMEVATEEALAEINAALRTGNVKQIKDQYGLHFPLSIRPRAKSAVARFFEAVKRIVNRTFGRGLTDAQVEDLLRRTNAAGMTPDGGPGRGSDAGARYSPSPKDWITEQGRITKRIFSKETAQRDLSLWQKTLGTQLGTALKNPAFKKVYDLTQRLIQHVNNDAYDSLNAAPDVLSRLEDWSDYKRDLSNTAKEAGAALALRQSKRRKDMTAAAEVLFEGTRFDKRVYSDKELDAFKLTADQKEIYRQARAAIDKSVGNAGKSQALNVAMNAKAINWATVERLVNMDLEPDALFSEVRDLIDTRIANAKMEIGNTKDKAEIDRLNKQVDKLVEAHTAIGEIQSIVEKSAAEGYAPLMRWGKYTVAVVDPVDGKTLRFHMLESKREQAELALKLEDKYGKANVVSGVMNEAKFEQFKGITPETVALFASVTGMDQDAAYQEYLKLAIPGRSALKRKIHRKGDRGEGIEGFSTDLPRVLSSFVLSNARKSARDLYRGPVEDAVDAIPKGAGGVQEQAQKLSKFVLEPDENDWSVGIRNMLFVWNMGASVAFGVLNLSQPWMMTMPWLSQFRSPTEAAGIMGRAAKLATAAQVSGKAPKGYAAEYDRAVREGIVDPQNVFMLQGVERGKSGVGSNIWRNVAHGMGLIAAATESMNRKLTLIAALDVARAKGDAWLKSKGFADAYDFAARAVAETQGIYNKGNRPAWARSPVGAVLLVFKQYAINWVEMASRMASNHYGDDRYRKGFWMLIGALFMMAGGMGLPFAEDLIDLIETGMSWAGKPVNVERQMQMALGKDLYEPLMNGPVNSMLFNPMGADMFGRMSMGNMIPATAVANPGLTWAARSDEAVQALGAGAGLASKFVDAYNQAASGNVGQALITASPRAITSIAKAAEMTATGEYKDSKGRTVRSVTPAEALIKGLDLQPASVARIQRERGRRFKDEAIQAQARTEIRNALIDAYESGDQASIDEANNRLRTWNNENPLYPVHINRRALRKTVRERGKNWSARDEAAKGMEWMNDWIPESSK